MSSLTDTYQPGDVVAFRVRAVSQKGLTRTYDLGSVTADVELLVFNGENQVFNGENTVINGE